MSVGDIAVEGQELASANAKGVTWPTHKASLSFIVMSLISLDIKKHIISYLLLQHMSIRCTVVGGYMRGIWVFLLEMKAIESRVQFRPTAPSSSLKC